VPKSKKDIQKSIGDTDNEVSKQSIKQSKLVQPVDLKNINHSIYFLGLLMIFIESSTYLVMEQVNLRIEEMNKEVEVIRSNIDL